MKSSPSVRLLGVVARVRINRENDPELPAMWMEYLTLAGQLTLASELERTWTKERGDATELDWDLAEKTAAEIGGGAHSITVSLDAREIELMREAGRPERIGSGAPEAALRRLRARRLPAWRRPQPSPEEVFEREERRHLA